MNANELMIGDWVSSEDEYYDRINTEPDGYNAITCVENSEVTPIPLTAEILEKNGFRQISTNKYVSGKLTIAVFAEEFLSTIKTENARVMVILNMYMNCNMHYVCAGLKRRLRYEDSKMHQMQVV